MRKSIKVEETSAGNINITCDVSGRPLVRTNQFGMFCDAANCQCEKESMAFDKDAFLTMIKTHFGVTE
jgi:hypothetical protein